MSTIAVLTGLCEASIRRGRRRGEPCMRRAVWSATVWQDGGWEPDALRLCGVHVHHERRRLLTEEDDPR